MPKLKLTGVKSQEVKSGFEAYDGPVPLKRGFYRAEIKSIKHGENSGGSTGFSIVVELKAAAGDPKGHAEYDGFPMFSHSIITETKDGSPLKEGSVNNLSNLLFALGAGDDPDVVTAEAEDGKKADVLKIGNKKPVGAVVNIDLGTETYNDEVRPTVSGIFKYTEGANDKTGGKPTFKPSDEEEPEDEAEDAEDADLLEGGDDAEYTAREEELQATTLAKLKGIAKELGVTGANKAALIEAILGAEFEEESEEDEAEDEEEPEDEEAEDEAEDEEEEEDDGSAERAEELATFDRIALKKILKEVSPDFTVLKKHTDDDLRDAIIAAEFGEETPF